MPRPANIFKFEFPLKSNGGIRVFKISDNDYPPFRYKSQFLCNEGTVNNLQSFYSNKKYILLKNLFRQQYIQLESYFEGINFEVANEKMAKSLNSLLETDPEIISMELTHDQSIFYTLKKGSFTFYLQHFLNDIDKDDDEATLIMFKGDDKLPSYAGSLTETMFVLNDTLLTNNLLKIEFLENELSF